MLEGDVYSYVSKLQMWHLRKIVKKKYQITENISVQH